MRGLGWITRRWHPRGTDRLIRLLHDPGTRPWSICTQVEIERYRLRFNVDTASFLEWTLFFYGIYEERTLSIIADSGREALRREVRKGRRVRRARCTSVRLDLCGQL